MEEYRNQNDLITESNFEQTYIKFKHSYNGEPPEENKKGIELVYLLREELQSPLVTKLPSRKDIKKLAESKFLSEKHIGSIELFGAGILSADGKDYLYFMSKVLFNLCPEISIRAHTGADLRLVKPTLEFEQSLRESNPQYSEKFGINVYGRINRNPARGMKSILDSAREYEISSHKFRGGLEHILPFTNKLAEGKESLKNLSIIKDFYIELAENNVHIVSLPETTGLLNPQETYASVMINLNLLNECGILSYSIPTQIELHFHNDSLNAKANLLAGIKAIRDYENVSKKIVNIKITFTALGGERNGINTAQHLEELGFLDPLHAFALRNWAITSFGIEGDAGDQSLTNIMTAGSHANYEMDKILLRFNNINNTQFRNIDELISWANECYKRLEELSNLAVEISKETYNSYSATLGLTPLVHVGIVGSARLIQYQDILEKREIRSLESAQRFISHIKSYQLNLALK